MATNKLSQYADKQAIDAVLRIAQSPAAGTVYLALLTALPSDGTLTMVGVTEYAATGYARQAIAFGAATSALPAVASNSGTVTFGPMTAGTGGVVTHYAICDAVSGTAANIIATGAWAASRTPGVGDSLSVAPAGVTVSNN